MNEKEFQNKSAIVTGGAMGIGGAVAKMLAQRGAKVLIVDKSESEGIKATEEINKSGGEAAYLKADVSNIKNCEAAINKAIEKYGKLDILSNNAGIQKYGTVETTSLEDWNEVMNVNLNSMFYMMKYAIPHLKKSKGNIVNMTSVQAFATQRNVAAYTTSKNAIIGLTKCTAIDYARDGVRVNCVAPGTTDTPMLRYAAEMDPDPESVYETCRNMHPLGRIATPEEVAEVVCFLASERASFVTGSCYLVEGGLLLPIGGEPKVEKDLK
ncbi:MAG TPA: SDR family oxidoreductase [Ignavibacteriaceae bacterium]|nr:SDR family oxidoreductase [Ignavibacteriaceae bacterium]